MLLKRLLWDEIGLILSIINKMLETYDKTKVVSSQYLNDIANARLGYDKNRDWLVLLEDQELRRQIFGFYSELLTLTSTANILNDWALKEFYPEYTQSEIPTVMNKFKDLTKEGNTIREKVKPLPTSGRS